MFHASFLHKIFSNRGLTPQPHSYRFLFRIRQTNSQKVPASSKLSDPLRPMNTQHKKPTCSNTSSLPRNTTHRSHPSPNSPATTPPSVTKKPKPTAASLPGRRVSNTSKTNQTSTFQTPVTPTPSRSLPAKTLIATIPIAATPISSPADVLTTTTTKNTTATKKTTPQRARVAMPPTSPEGSFSTPVDSPNSLPIWCGPTKNTYPVSSTPFIFKRYAVPCVLFNGRIVALHELVGSANGIAWGFRGVFLVARDVSSGKSTKDSKYVSKKKEIVPREPVDEVLKVQAVRRFRSCKMSTGKLWGIEENEEE